MTHLELIHYYILVELSTTGLGLDDLISNSYRVTVPDPLEPYDAQKASDAF